MLWWMPFWGVLPASEKGTDLPQPVGKIMEPALKEASGLTPSRKVPGRFWSHNDSGHAPEIFALDSEGHALATVKIEGGNLVDWEAMETDGEGGMWIGDFGNNLNRRRDLILYRVEEPGHQIPRTLQVSDTVRFRYSDQQAFPPEKMNFDCEAMFVWDQKLYLLTKHRSDRDTKLYRIEDWQSDEVHIARLIDRFEWIGQVSDAALTSDGSRLAVLTYSGIWIFNRPEDSDNFLKGNGQKWLFPNWSLKQVEGIAWLDEQSLLLCNEQRRMFTLQVVSDAWVPFSGSSVQSVDESP